jgi:2-polyprenyl-6-methoxyphenol hydroxylase-like FAD-dependent oxidoreductase
MQRRNILVVGAGPVGSVAALACARFGHTVTLLEAQAQIDDSPRASTTQPPTLEIIAELGLIDEYIRVGLVARTFEFWDRPTLTRIAEFDFERLRDETDFPFVVQTEQHKLANMALERLRRLPNVELVMGVAVSGVEQDEKQVTVTAGERLFRADYVIGADGGRSTVRKSLDIDFEGYTWPERFLVITTKFDFERLRDETDFPFVVQTEQHKLANMALERLRRLPNVELVMGVAVSGVEQDEKQVTVTAGERLFRADYVIGADGGRSTVRKSLDIEFEGYTWPERFLVITTKFDFAAALGCCYRNYMADPHEWTNLFKVAGDDLKGRWRAVFNTREDESDEEALSDPAVRARLGRIYVPDGERDYLHLNLYNVHQRVAKNFRKGRVFLCGDAAHVNNPIGGLGLNSGIHEAWDLAELLDKVLRQEADNASLDAYEARRRPLNIEYVQEQTVANKKRLEEREPAQRERRFQELRDMAQDPQRHKAFLMRASLLESARRAIRN